jgi:hypothetical protein
MFKVLHRVESGNEPSGYIEHETLSDWLSDYQLLKNMLHGEG